MGCFFYLYKGLEDLGALGLGDADAGVGDGKADFFALGLIGGLRLNRHGHAAFIGELDGVANDVEQQLVDFSPVANHRLGHVRRYFEPQGNALVLGRNRLQRQHGLDAVTQPEGLQLQVDLAGFDA